MWPRGEIPADFLEPVSSNAPVLIFSGSMDPITPPKYGEEVARHLRTAGILLFLRPATVLMA